MIVDNSDEDVPRGIRERSVITKGFTMTILELYALCTTCIRMVFNNLS